MELTKNIEILNNPQNQNFELDDLLLKVHIKESKKLNTNKKRLCQLTTKVQQLQEIERLMKQKFMEIFERIANRFDRMREARCKQLGLTQRRIERFRLFVADETHVSDQCSICMEDIDVGRRMRRLTCDGQHYFCQECIEGWFTEHNTCPLCRHIFD